MAEVAGEDFTEEAGADVHLAVAEVVVAAAVLEAEVSVEAGAVAEEEAELNHSAAEAAVGAALSRTSNVRPAEVAAASNFHRRDGLAAVEVVVADLAGSVETPRRVDHRVFNRARLIDNQYALAATPPHEDRIANRCDRGATTLREDPVQTDSQRAQVAIFHPADPTASPCVPAATLPHKAQVVSPTSTPIAVR